MSNPSSQYYLISLIAFSSTFANYLIPGIIILSILLDLRHIFRVLVVKHGFCFQIPVISPHIFLSFTFIKKAGSPYRPLKFCFGCILLCPSALIQYQSHTALSTTQPFILQADLKNCSLLVLNPVQVTLKTMQEQSFC